MSAPRASLLAAAIIAGTLGLGVAARAAEEAKIEPVGTPTRQSWSFSGVFGKFDQAQLQRGFQVYREVCSQCHKLSIPMRTVGDPDGPGFSEAQVKALAASYKVQDEELDAKGLHIVRNGRPSDLFPAPEAYPSDAAAVATFGKVPPDMWVLAKARKYERGFPMFLIDALPGFQYQEIGADYIYAILHGYTKPDDPQWNLYYPPNHVIAMPAPLSDDAVKYTDGTPAKLDNMAADVAAFLSWTAEPTMTQRKKTGVRVMVFLALLASGLYYAKKRVWADAH